MASSDGKHLEEEKYKQNKRIAGGGRDVVGGRGGTVLQHNHLDMAIFWTWTLWNKLKRETLYDIGTRPYILYQNEFIIT